MELCSAAQNLLPAFVGSAWRLPAVAGLPRLPRPVRPVPPWRACPELLGGSDREPLGALRGEADRRSLYSNQELNIVHFVWSDSMYFVKLKIRSCTAPSVAVLLSSDLNRVLQIGISAVPWAGASVPNRKIEVT
jgi:hypothetical protein